MEGIESFLSLHSFTTRSKGLQTDGLKGLKKWEKGGLKKTFKNFHKKLARVKIMLTFAPALRDWSGIVNEKFIWNYRNKEEKKPRIKKRSIRAKIGVKQIRSLKNIKNF